jgi:trimeric autotransporter adhesin
MNKLKIIIALFVSGLSFSQVGINTTTPNAQLDIRSSNQALPSNKDGVLIPKIDVFPAINPSVDQDGMMVYLTTAVGIKSPGFYYWDNSTISWQVIGSKTSWSLNGNSLSGAEFLGSTNDKDVVFKRFNDRAGHIGFTNTSFGELTLKSTNTGLFNTAFGSNSLNANTSGAGNTALGRSSLSQNTTGGSNVALGVEAMFTNLTGGQNVAVGYQALYKSKGESNVAVGYQSLYNLNFATNLNTSIGYKAGYNQISGNRNLMIGQNTDVNNLNGNDQMNIANTIYGSEMGTINSKIGIGEKNPLTKLEINGGLTLKVISATNNANLVITVGDRSYIRITVGGATNQLRLTNGLSVGQILYIQYDGSAGNCSVQDTPNINCAGIFTMDRKDIAQFIWDGTAWTLVSFSDNN